jgi:hypothetical protein
MTALQVLVVTNMVLGPKSYLTGKDRLVEPLSLKLRDNKNSVRCQLFSDQLTTRPNFLT